MKRKVTALALVLFLMVGMLTVCSQEIKASGFDLSRMILCETLYKADDDEADIAVLKTADTQNTESVSADTYTLDSDAAAARRQELEALFADAQTLGGAEEALGNTLRIMMEDDSVSAIIIPSGTTLVVMDAPLTVTKPVLVETDVYFSAWNTITIDGENACVYVKGGFHPEGVVRTVNGGRIVMDGEGSQFDSKGTVWLESNADLEILGGNFALDREQLKVLNLNDAFVNSQEVSTAEEFKAALNNYAADSITVTGDITVDAEGEDHLYIPIPVRVDEGASLTVTGGADSSGETIYLGQDAVLVNYGTLNACLSGDSPLIYNSGSWTGGMFAYPMDACNLLLLNQGEMTLGDNDSYNTLDGNISFYNEGTLTVGNGVQLNLSGDLFSNRGTVTITGENTTFRIAEGIIANNLGGEIHIESGTQLYNGTGFEVRGNVSVEGGEFLNEGTVTLRGTLSQQSGQVRNTGLILIAVDDFGVLELTERSGGRIEELPAEGTDGCVTVSSGEDLQAAMDDASVQSIIIENGAAYIDGDLTVTKPVLAIGDLSVSGTLTVAGGFLAQYDYSNPINAGDIVLENGTFLFQQNNLCTGSLTVGEGAAYYRGGTRYSECEEGPWGTYLETVFDRIEIADGGQMYNLSLLTLYGTEIQIQTGGELLSRGPLELNGCQVNIASEGYLQLGGGYRISEDTTVVNDGWLETSYTNGFKEGR